MTIQQLAVMMGQKESDVLAFVNCLRVWTDKGYSLEAAIEKHKAQMARFVDNATSIPKRIAVEAFY